MIDSTALRTIAAERLQEAGILLANARYDGANYLGGYVVEVALKARICDTLNWSGYPETDGEFKGLQSFKIHDFVMLLRLSGRELWLKQNYLTEWNIVKGWRPEMRYRRIGQASQADAQAFLQAVTILLQQI